MALMIETQDVCGVFAFGTWFKVVPGTFYIDAFNLRQWFASVGEPKEFDTPFIDYEMGALYKKDEPEFRSASYGPNSRGTYETPTGSTGCTFIDAISGERVSFSLMEVRAFREIGDKYKTA